jgi:hypothetical protein
MSRLGLDELVEAGKKQLRTRDVGSNEDEARRIFTAAVLRRLADYFEHNPKLEVPFTLSVIASEANEPKPEPEPDIRASLRALAPFIRVVQHHICRSLADAEAEAELRGAADRAVAALEGGR